MDNKNGVISTVGALKELLIEFSNTIDYERNSLVAPNADQLASLLVKKDQLIHKLNHLHPTLISRISNSPETDADFTQIGEIKRLIEKCQQMNKENGVLVAQNLKITKNTIHLLTQDAQWPSVETYDIHGHTATTPGKRDHGVA